MADTAVEVPLGKPKRGRPPSKKKTEAEEAAREDAEAAREDAERDDAYNQDDDSAGAEDDDDDEDKPVKKSKSKAAAKPKAKSPGHFLRLDLSNVLYDAAYICRVCKSKVEHFSRPPAKKTAEGKKPAAKKAKAKPKKKKAEDGDDDSNEEDFDGSE